MTTNSEMVELFTNNELDEIEHATSNDQKTEEPQFKLNWQHIINSVHHEMWPRLSSILKSIIENHHVIDNGNVEPDTVHKIFDILKTKRNLEQNELNYLNNLIQRAKAFNPIISVPNHDEVLSGNDSQQISAQHPAITASLLTDIFNVHRSFLWSNYHFLTYTVSDFMRDIKDNRFLSDLTDIDFTPKPFELYPSYLIHNNIFETFNYLFAVSFYIDSIRKQCDNLSDFELHSFVVPQSIVSLYDDNISFDYNLGDIDSYLQHKNIHHFARNIIRSQRIEDMNDIKQFIQRTYHPKDVQYDKATKLMIIIDRRHLNRVSHDIMYIFSCSDLSIFDELRVNHCIGFEFKIQNDRIFSYFLYGINQRIRFYPELLECFIPRIFTKNTKRNALNLYNHPYKHGFCLLLTDGIFNTYYKMITGYDFVSVNYNRDVIPNKDKSSMILFIDILFFELKGDDSQYMEGFKQYLMDNDYDSDSILFDISDEEEEGTSSFIQNYFEQHKGSIAYTKCRNIVHQFFAASHKSIKEKAAMKLKKCDMDNIMPVQQCKHIEYIIYTLESFASFHFEIDHVQMNQFNLPYVLQSYDHIVSVHGSKGKQYIFESMGECTLNAKCAVLSNHCKRNRERTNKTKTDMEDEDEENLREILKSSLNSIHCYILHSKRNLFRLESNAMNEIENNRFTTAVEKQEIDNDNDNDKISSINFGVSVLTWLAYDVLPIFRNMEDEIVHNAASTISHRLYLNFKQECFIKCVTNKGRYYTLDELLSLKIYTDTTQYQCAFRKAFWTSAKSAIRRSFYFWALQLYKTALYHAIPITGSLFHGLTQVFVVRRSLPMYNGPISTTVELSVAHIFSEQNGLIWEIRGSFLRRFKFVKGISVEWISQFKHEAEVLLVNQYLPIKDTTNFKNNVNNMVDHLLYTLESMEDTIKDMHQFYKRIGFKWRDDFLAIIEKHFVLYRASALGSTHCVLQRLVEELHVEHFMEQYKVLKSRFVIYDHKALYSLCCIDIYNTDLDEDVFVDCKYKLVKDNDEIKHDNDAMEFEYDEEIQIKNNIHYRIYVQNIKLFATNKYILLQEIEGVGFDDTFSLYLYDHLQIVDDDRIELNAELYLNHDDDDDESEDEDDAIINMDQEIEKQILSATYALVLCIVGHNEPNWNEFESEDMYECKDMDEFIIDLPQIDDMDNMESIYWYKLYIKTNTNILCKFMLFKTFYLKEYRFLKAITINDPININRVCDGTGHIAIFSEQTITIGQDGSIDAEQCGFDNYELAYQTTTGMDDEFLRFGTSTANKIGGGIIELIANDNIVNHGTLMSNGGSIKIGCRNTFINNGQILSSNHGNISISCSQYENNDESSINPSPELPALGMESMDNAEFTDIECVLNRNTEGIKLKICDHNGHKNNKDKCDPNNVLIENGECYLSKDLSVTGIASDWIIFSMQRPYWIRNVVIRNHGLKNAIKNVVLYLGNEESKRNNKWHRLSIINNIKMNRNQQDFQVQSLIDINTIWNEKFNLIKMHIVENHGHKTSNRFTRFAVFGRAIY